MRNTPAHYQFLDLIFGIGIYLGFGFWDLGFTRRVLGFIK